MMNTSYQLIDSGNFRKLEQLGPYRIVRPSAQAVWRPGLPAEEWTKVDAEFLRKSGGEGNWRVFHKNLPKSWNIKNDALRLMIKLTDFGHIGLFPEQSQNWKVLKGLIQPEIKVLNLFGYTGIASLTCAAQGAKVTHVDASKTTVAWARANAELSGLEAQPIRWLIDDVSKFVRREVKRKSKYEGIIMDPPSYGRGPDGEVWDIEKHLLPLLDDLQHLMSDNFRFFLLSCHSPGYTPLSLRNLLESICKGGEMLKGEMVIVEQQERQLPLPSGAFCLFKPEN